jgi:hypothetical protein
MAFKTPSPDLSHGGERKLWLEFEMHENAAEVLIVLLQPVIQLFDLRLGQETQDALFELPGALAGYDLDQRNPLVHRLVDDAVEFGIDN